MQPLWRIVREDFWAFRCCTNTCSLFFSQRAVDWFCSLFEPFLNKVVVLLHISMVITELTAVMAAASTMTLESRVKRHPPSSSNGSPAFSDKQITKRAWTFLLKAFCGVMIFSWWSMQCELWMSYAMLKAFEQTSNLWPSSYPSSQCTWIAGKSYCTSISFYHRIALLMCFVVGYGWEIHHCKRLHTTDRCLRADTCSPPPGHTSSTLCELDHRQIWGETFNNNNKTST